MENRKNILIAFILNLLFSAFELFGGMFTGSVAILSDAIHDFGDAAGIGISYLCERKSKRNADDVHTYGYFRYSVLGGFITTVILLIGSFGVVYQGILRLWNPVPIDYNGMILFAVVGVMVNGLAAFFTRDGHSVNQRAVNLHMLEDVLGWITVLVGAVVMRFTNWYVLDALLSVGVAGYILFHAFRNVKIVVEIFLEKVPKIMDVNALRKQILCTDGVEDLHHFHFRSLDGFHYEATMHLVVSGNQETIKQRVRHLMEQYHIIHSVIETHNEDFVCKERVCPLSGLTFEEGHSHHH